MSAINITRLLLWSLSLSVMGQTPVLRFAHISSEQGLSHNTVTSAIQDRQGFMWFGTIDGLNRYDGYTTKVFKHDPENPSSISSSFIHTLIEDDLGNLWIATRDGGISLLKPENRNSGRFIRFQPEAGRNGTPSHRIVQTLYLDSKQRLWAGTEVGLDMLEKEGAPFVHYRLFDKPTTVTSCAEDNNGILWVSSHNGLVALDLNQLDQIDPNDCRNQIRHFVHDPAQPAGLSTQMINSLFQDSQGQLWLGTRGQGISLMDKEQGRFVHYRHDPKRASLSKNTANVLFEDEHGLLWIGTDGGGLNIMDPKTGVFTTYQHQPTRAESLSQNNVTSVVQSRDGAKGTIWVLTWGGGVNRLLTEDKPFALVRHDPENDNSPSSNFIFALCEDRFGDLWVGSMGKGLDRWDRSSGIWQHFRHDPTDAASLSNNNIWNIAEDRSGNLWISTEHGGLNRVSRKNRNDPVRFQSIKGLPEDNLHFFFEDKDGNYWVGGESLGLSRQSPQQRAGDSWTHFREQADVDTGLSSDMVRCISQDSQGAIWVGTLGGLNRFETHAGLDRVTLYRHDANDPTSLGHNDVRTVLETRAGQFWVGTYGAGLNRLDRENGVFQRVDEEQGLPNNFVYGLLEDARGDLWVSTNRGLGCLDSISGSWQHYGPQHGLQSDEFNTGAYFGGRDGTLYFGGVNGFNYFHPTELAERGRRELIHPPAVRVTAFTKMGEALTLPQQGPVILAHSDKFFSVDFAVLDYHNPTKNRYNYRLQGFDDTWIDSGQRAFAGYTNLDPGSYSLLFRGANSAGVWSDGEPLQIVIRPPFWQRWWFRTLVLAAALLAVLLGFQVKKFYAVWRGTKYVGHFKLLQRIGEGGSGTVYQARDRLSRRIVALKVLHGRLEESRDGIRRFLQEAEIGQRLKNDRIVTIYEAGSQGKTRYISMEYLEGQTLKDYRRERGTLKAEELFPIADQILDGLAAIHEQEIVHRDLKSANIMVLEGARIKIMDFGLARISVLTTVENRNQLMGTLAYMSPEQTVGKAVDKRSDIYAFGVILYELQFGELPFRAENEMEMIFAIHNEVPPRLAAEVKSGLPAVTARCLEKHPEDRYQTVADLKDQLAHASC